MNKHSRVCANIDLSAIMHNMEAMHQNIDPDTKIMAVIKADGYGHGAVPIAKEIEHLDYVYGYAAATVEEGMILRNNGIQKPILILGYIFPDQYEEVIQAEICPSVFTLEMAEELSAAAEKVGKDCRMHFAVDTGMSRIGYQVTEEAADEMAQIAKLPHMIVEGIFVSAFSPASTSSVPPPGSRSASRACSFHASCCSGRARLPANALAPSARSWLAAPDRHGRCPPSGNTHGRRPPPAVPRLFVPCFPPQVSSAPGSVHKFFPMPLSH